MLTVTPRVAPDSRKDESRSAQSIGHLPASCSHETLGYSDRHFPSTPWHCPVLHTSKGQLSRPSLSGVPDNMLVKQLHSCGGQTTQRSPLTLCLPCSERVRLCVSCCICVFVWEREGGRVRERKSVRVCDGERERESAQASWVLSIQWVANVLLIWVSLSVGYWGGGRVRSAYAHVDGSFLCRHSI